jgi:signal transduction histidine kinase
MSELQRLAPETRLPTQPALRLSTRLVERGVGAPGPGGFRQTPIDGIWALTSADSRVVGLYGTERLQSLIDQALAPLMPRGVRFVAHPPDAPGDDEAIAAGPSLPGWQLSFVVLGDPIAESSARTRLLTYLWAGFAATAVFALAGIFAGQSLSRQLQLARLKTDLTAAVSHELRAPLASIQVLLDGLLAGEHLDPVKTTEYLRLIASEHGRLTRVIENFLSFSRLERGRRGFDLQLTSPSALIASSVDAIKERLPPGCDLRVDVADGLPPIMADSYAFGTALTNLLDNAVKFTPDEKHIVVRGFADGRDVVFTVGDNGPGIAVSEQRRIFRQFYRVDQRLTRETRGVGLGLSIVALVVRGHGGRVNVSSEPGRGSTFAVRVPAVTRPSA